MRYGEGLLEEIRRRTDLVALVGRRVKLVRKGRVMWGCCPFHGEKSPSFKVENERRAYKCFGCGVGGDAFKWLMETEGLSFPESVEKLAAEVGVELPKWSPEDEAREQKKKSLYDIVELAAQFLETQLFEAGGRAARDYLKARGLDGAAAQQFRLGYAPGNGQALIEFLKAQKCHPGRHDRGGIGAARRGQSPDAGFLFRPADVSDLRRARPHDRLRRARAGGRRQAQIHQHRRNGAVFQGFQSLQFRRRPRRRDQGGQYHRRRRLYGCDRAGARRLRSCGGAAGHRADRRPIAIVVAHRAGTDPGF